MASAFCSAPAALYMLLWGRSAFEHAKANSFGWEADFYYIPLLQFLGDTIRDAPGLVLSFVLITGALIYLVIKRRLRQSWLDFLALMIMIGFGIIVLASSNREIRFAFPVIVALPFLAAIVMSGKGHSASHSSAALAAGLVFCGFLVAGVPSWYRANIQSIERSRSVLIRADLCNASHIMLATDSPTLNSNLMSLAIAVSASRDSVTVGTLAYNAMGNVPIEEDFRTIRGSDQVVFQHREGLTHRIENQRVSEYERYLQQGGYVPIRVDNDVDVYSIQCRPSSGPKS
jgi:hypothetical protein